MTSLFSGPQVAYLIIALVVLGLAFAGIVWVGRTIRGELGPGAGGGSDPGGRSMLEQIPPAMMKEAIAKGLVIPSQLASMSPVERAFLFASLKQQLGAALPAAHAEPAVAPPVAPADVPPGMLAMLNAEKLRVWCPMCGAELQLPTFPPIVARCTNCGMKSAVRREEGGRYTVMVSPPRPVC